MCVNLTEKRAWYRIEGTCRQGFLFPYVKAFLDQKRSESVKHMERYICIHGHFYQPPRENPWLETVEVQDSAHPYHDWNERITAECYAANATSRILDEHDLIAVSDDCTSCARAAALRQLRARVRGYLAQYPNLPSPAAGGV